jgi:tetratricopeptide (TPR) repeat protein
MPRATLIVGLGLASALATGACASKDLRDLYFGEAVYYANQGHYFEALERLDAELALHKGVDEPQRDSLHYHIGEAEFSVGDFELYYRMHHRAGHAIKAVLEGAVDENVRNEAAYRLARIHFQKDQAADALVALDRITGKVPVAIRDDVEFLRANVYLALGRPGDAAAVLKRLQSAQSLTGFAAYNLGIAMLQEGREQDAISQLDRAGQLKVSDAGPLAIRDKSNMLLGKLMLEATDFPHAQQYFDRVRLDGPFSNQALLSSGWADVSSQNFERAVVPWSILAKREVTDAAVQEALLALPYAYSKLNVHGRAAVLYGDALKSFGEELNKVDASIKSIADGRFLKALVREELQQDKGWVIRLRTLPDSPETFYLMQLMASNDFQTALQNYLDLEELRKKMAGWQKSLDAYEDMIRLRKQNYEPLLPGIDSQFRELDAQIRLRMEQRNHLQQRLHQLLVEPRPDLLANTDERIALEHLRASSSALEKRPARTSISSNSE